jgi:hypothetical protein
LTTLLPETLTIVPRSTMIDFVGGPSGVTFVWVFSYACAVKAIVSKEAATTSFRKTPILLFFALHSSLTFLNVNFPDFGFGLTNIVVR